MYQVPDSHQRVGRLPRRWHSVPPQQGRPGGDGGRGEHGGHQGRAQAERGQCQHGATNDPGGRCLQRKIVIKVVGYDIFLYCLNVTVVLFLHHPCTLFIMFYQCFAFYTHNFHSYESWIYTFYCSASRSFVSLTAHTCKIYNPSAEFKTFCCHSYHLQQGIETLPPIIMYSQDVY